MGQIKAKINGVDETIGIKTQAQVVKNRMGPPLRKAEFEIYFDSGVDDYGGWLKVMKAQKLVSAGGAWYTYVTDAGKTHKFLSKDWQKLLDENPEIKDEVYHKICNSLIMEYKTEDIGIDDIQISDEPIPEG